MTVIHPCHVVHTFYWKWGLACSYDFKLGPIFNCGVLVQITGQQVSTVIVPAQSNITCTHFTWNMLIHGMLYTFYKVGCAPDKVIWHWHYQWQCTASIIQHKKLKLIRPRRIFLFFMASLCHTDNRPLKYNGSTYLDLRMQLFCFTFTRKPRRHCRWMIPKYGLPLNIIHISCCGSIVEYTN